MYVLSVVLMATLENYFDESGYDEYYVITSSTSGFQGFSWWVSLSGWLPKLLVELLGNLTFQCLPRGPLSVWIREGLLKISSPKRKFPSGGLSLLMSNGSTCPPLTTSGWLSARFLLSKQKMLEIVYE